MRISFLRVPIILSALFLGAHGAITLAGCDDGKEPAPPPGSGGEGGSAGGPQDAGIDQDAGDGGAMPCLADEACDDAIACTKDRCIQGACYHEILTLTGCAPDHYCDPAQGGCVKAPPCTKNDQCQGVFIDHPCIAVKYCKPASMTCDFLLRDDDADGHVPTTCGGDDCDDDALVVHPGAVEVCDGVDNECSGVVDDLPGIDLNSPKTCGTCSKNCYADQGVGGCDVSFISCAPSPMPGLMPGTCVCGKCAPDFYDLDNNGSCEYFCLQSAADDAACNNKDDDCDGDVDEDVNKCTDTNNCGTCGATCVVLHGTPACVNNGSTPCGAANTACAIQQCDCNGPNDCWKDLDKSYATGCEYLCAETNNGVEICDGLDNNCNGLVDDAPGCP